jgi:hypothetical protein
LDLTVAGVAAAQQYLTWQQRCGVGPKAAAAAKGANSSSKGQAAGDVVARLASRMPQLSMLKLYYNTTTQVRPAAAAAACLLESSSNSRGYIHIGLHVPCSSSMHS